MVSENGHKQLLTYFEVDIIHLMHYTVNIRICQPENSDTHLGEAKVNITFEGLLIQMLAEKNAPIVCYMKLYFLS